MRAIDVNIGRVRSVHAQSMSSLRAYHPKFIVDAQKILPLMAKMDNSAFLNVPGLRDGESISGRSYLLERMQAFVRFNPENFSHLPEDFAEILTTMRILRENLKGLRVLQIAGNYSPFLHFLKHEEGMDVAGADTCSFAAEYAREEGVDVRTASATELPFPANYFDFVISRNFFDEAYLMSISEKGNANHFAEQGMTEVHRVLRPEAHLVSFVEDTLPFPGHAAPQGFSREATMSPEIANLRLITVFKK